MSKPAPPPAAVLIRLVREAAGIKIPPAAKAAGITKQRWSQIELGYERREGTYHAIDNPPPGTVARMASVLPLTPERLASEGERPDAAAILAEIRRTDVPAPPPQPGHHQLGDYADPRKDELAQWVWEQNFDEKGPVFDLVADRDVLRGVVELLWLRETQNTPASSVPDGEQHRVAG